MLAAIMAVCVAMALVTGHRRSDPMSLTAAPVVNDTIAIATDTAVPKPEPRPKKVKTRHSKSHRPGRATGRDHLDQPVSPR